MISLDIFAVAYVGLMIIIGIALFSAPIILTFFLYRTLKKKGKVKNIIGLTVFIITTLAMVTIVIKILTSPSGFGPEYDSVVIEQKIGGKLLCESVYTADMHEWQYDVSYEYVATPGDTIDLGSGSYYAREWTKDEQLIRSNKWLILKTGNWSGSDRVIMKNLQTQEELIYNLDDEFIERDSLWKVQKVKSLTDYCCAESYIEKISDKIIIIRYRFRIDENMSDKYDERKITYRINGESGNLKMIKIEKYL